MLIDGADDRPVPLSDVASAPYWDAMRDQRLMVQQCEVCDKLLFPPLVACSCCWGELVWVEVSGRGSVHSFATVHFPAVKGYDPPFVVADIELEEEPGLLMSANIVGCDVARVHIGMRVEVIFERRRAGTVVPQFRPG